ncbi:MAG: hypothetical protein LBB40_01725, partial [Holophagales bacterium]|nr:hypothetical protein [Holophagales bacterium]
MKIELGGGRSGNRLVTMSIESTGDQLFDLSKGTRSKGEIVPLLHRVAANTANLCARMAQEAVVNRMGEIFNIRYRSSSSRFPSFIQQQVKIAKFAKTSDFPNISAILEIQPQAKSSRSDNPLILDTLELGTMRNPFVGKRLAIPVSEGTREGGVFKGKVKPQYKWKNLGLGKGRNPARAPVAGSEMRERRGKHGKRFVSSHASLFQEQENRVYGKSGIYLVHALDDPN